MIVENSFERLELEIFVKIKEDSVMKPFKKFLFEDEEEVIIIVNDTIIRKIKVMKIEEDDI